MRALFHRYALIPAIVILACIGTAFAQDEGPEVTRADLATAYLRLEMALKDATLDDAETVRVNKEFDAATLAFFAGRMGEAIATINDLAASIGTGELDRALAIPSTLRVAVDPPVLRLDSDSEATLTVEHLYGRANEEDANPITVWIGDESDPLFKWETGMTTLAREGGTKKIPLGDAKPQPGRHTIYASLGDLGPGIEVGQWSVVPESLDAVAARNAKSLNAIEAATPALEQAKASCAARNALLSDNPSPENTAQLLFDPHRLASEVAAEIEALASGQSPYANRKGDYWRVLKVGDKESPMRVYCPDGADTSAPLPFVIAFHGAGGDENMFMDAYGAGIIKEAADKHGFLLVTPRTYDYGGNNIGDMFDALVEAIGHDYDIDANRIYVLGHSMGGGATNNLINARPDAIAAAAPICGFRQLTTSADETPPTLVIAAELDPLARPARVEPGAQKAIDEGLPVEYKLVKNYGHTLVVGDIMHETIDWLLKHERE